MPVPLDRRFPTGWNGSLCHSFIFHSDGSSLQSRGYLHQLKVNGWMKVYIKTSSTYYALGASISGPEKWALVVQSWYPSSGIKLYVNGCIVSISTRRWVRSHNISSNADLVIGKNAIHIEIDNFLAWDGKLTDNEVWRLYMQAGRV